MTFRLSKRSYRNLEGVSGPMIEVVELAIQITRIDFGVIEGVRTPARQRELVAAGASQTMQSRHLTGDAVDVMAYVGNRGSWESQLYYPIADALKAAGMSLGINIRWGGAWTVRNLTQWPERAEDAMWEYANLRRSQGRQPFLDLGHFELL